MSSCSAGRTVLVLALALATGGVEQKKKRQCGHNYLARADLHPEPRIGTALDALYSARNGKAFIKTTRVDVRTFHFMLDRFEPRCVWF